MKYSFINKSILLKLLLVILMFMGNDCTRDNDIKKREVTLLNVSYDATREFYRDFNKAFRRYYKNEKGILVNINQSHGGSARQSQSVINGLEADVVTLALAYDINEIKKSKLINEDWQNDFPKNSSPYTSTIVFLVREGNPKNIKDWDDLIREDVSVITPNPKTSGAARWNYLAAWAFASRKFNRNEKKIKKFMEDIFNNVPVFNTGARGSANSFIQRETGDVLITWENEALLANEVFTKNKYKIIYPSLSILAQPPVAVVDSVVGKKGTIKVAEDYLNYLFSDEGQEIIAWHYFRPVNIKILNKYRDQFPTMEVTNINREFGGWENAHKIHFSDGGTFDQIFNKQKPE